MGGLDGGSAPPSAGGRLPQIAAPTAYRLALEVDPEKDRFSGQVTIALEIVEPTTFLVLHARTLTIDRAVLRLGDASYVLRATSRMAPSGKEDPEELVLELGRRVVPGHGTLEIAYHAAFVSNERGLYRVSVGGNSYAFTQLEPSDARRVFPCFDEPSYKVPLTLQVTTPRDLQALSNTEEVESVTTTGDRVTRTFHQTPPLPTYLLALAVGRFDYQISARAPRVRLVTTPGLTHLGARALAVAEPLLRAEERYFGRRYPYSKLDLLGVPEFGAGAMENPGLITFREELLLLDSNRASEGADLRMTQVLAHELAHQWFGNLVTMRWWDDLWLNEGFATWMATKTLDAWNPRAGASLDFIAGRLSTMVTDAMTTARAVRQPVVSTSDALEAFDGITYIKGAAILTMLESWLGAATFQGGVRAYLDQHAHSSASADDLFRALEQVSAKPVGSVARTFLDKPGVPLVTVRLECTSGRAIVHLAQQPYRLLSIEPSPATQTEWKVPICVRSWFEGSPSKKLCTVLEGASSDLELGPACPVFLHSNDQEASYYFSELSAAQARAGLSRIRWLDGRTRLGLLGDAWASILGGSLDAASFLDMLSQLSASPERPVIVQVAAILEQANRALVGDEARTAFAAFVSKLLTPVARKYHYFAGKPADRDAKLIRGSILNTLGDTADDPRIVQEAERAATRYLAGKEVDPNVTPLALRLASRHAGPQRFEELVGLLLRAKTPEERIVALSALGGFHDEALLRRALDLTLTDQVKAQDVRYVSSAAMRTSTGKSIYVRWLYEHFDGLNKKLPGNGGAALTFVIANLCDAGPVAEAQVFFKQHALHLEGAEHALRVASESASQCLTLREHYRTAMLAWLQRSTASTPPP